MINLLPVEEKKKLLTEYRLRLGVVSVFAVTILVFSSLIFLAPSYILTVTKYNDAMRALTVLRGKSAVDGQRKNTEAQIVAINNRVAILLGGDAEAQVTPSDIIMSILNIKGPSIKIYGFTYNTSAGRDVVVVSGFALDRDSLAQFVGTLKMNTDFVSVDLPISSYVKSENIDFSVVVTRDTGNHKEK